MSLSDTVRGVFSFETDRRILTLAFARLADGIGNSFLIVVLPLYIGSGVVTGNTFGLGVAFITGIILSAYGFLNSVLQPFVGRWSDRTGKRRIFIVVGLVILAVANFAYSLAGSYVAMIGLRALQGIGVAITIPSTIAMVNELASGGARGANLGVYNTFRLLGFGFGPLLAGVAINGGPYVIAGLRITGFESAFYIAALGALIGAVLVTLFVEDPDPEEMNAGEAGEEFELAIFDHDHDALLDPVLTLGIASLFVALGIALISPLENQINNHLGQGATLFGLEFTAFTISQVIFQTPIGSASDRYGRKPFIVWGMALLVPATLAQGIVVSPIGMIITRLVQGLAGAMAFAPAFALAGDLAGGKSGTTLSVLTMAFGLGTAIGPLIAGFLVGFGYIVPFAFGAASAALGAILVYTQVRETITTDSEVSEGTQLAGQD